MRRRLLAVIGGLVLLAGCGGAVERPRAVAHPSDLRGLWRAEGPGIAGETYLRLDRGNRFFLFQRCGSPFGQWRAVPGGAVAFLLVVGAPDCPPSDGADEWERTTPGWLRAVATFHLDGERRVLLDRAGGRLARLTPVSEAPGADLPGERVAQEGPDRAEIAQLDDARPPPAGLRRAEVSDVAGPWLPADRARGVFVEFGADGSMRLRDGCNTGRGRWALGPGGAWAAVLSLSYVVSCENAPVADWLQTAVWATFDNSGFVLVGADGKVLGTLVKV
ncbi:MAG: hypothetical protein ACT4QF_22880 [Sporichthyaceae bacterium]